MAMGMTDVAKIGEQLSGMVGESEQPVVTESLQEVDRDYSSLREVSC